MPDSTIALPVRLERTDVRRWLPSAAIFVVGLLVYAPMMWYQAHDDGGSDFQIHAIIAKLMWSQHRLLVPHPLFHILTIAIAGATGMHVVSAGWIITVGCLSVLPVIVYRSLRQSMGERMAILGALALALVHPLIVPWIHHYYLGFIALTTYHSPTMILMRPIALVHFFLVVRVFKDGETPKLTVWAAILMVAATLAKPSYATVILPALVMYTALLLMRGRQIPWRFLIYGTALPAVLLLVWQLVVTYVFPLPNFDAKVEWAPFAAVQSVTDYGLAQFALSILFPLVVVVLFPKDFTQSEEAILAQLTFVSGAAMFYLLAESGRRMTDLNFSWGANMSLYFCYLAAYRTLARSQSTFAKWKVVVAYTVLIAQCISGVAFYLSDFNSPNHGAW